MPTRQKKPAESGSTPKERKRILVVDDHPFMRAGLGLLLNQQPDLQVVGEAGNPLEARKLLPTLNPDLIITDLTMPGTSGLDFIRDLKAESPALTILVVSMHDESIYAERAIKAGARGYVMKESGGEGLLAAVRQVLSGRVYVSPGMAARILDGLSNSSPKKSSSPIGKLSDREFEVFQLIGQGKGTQEIAKRLHISTKTVDVHRAHVKEKLGIADVTGLVRFAVRWLESDGANQ